MKKKLLEKTFKIRTHLKESSTTGATSNAQSVSKFNVLLIEEGLGNLRDCFYYTKESLKNAADTGLFEGKKCFADHPSEIEETTRPERSTRDILGYYENVRYEESSEGRGRLVGDLHIMVSPAFSWAQTLMATSVEYAQKYPSSDFAGLSINASGSASEVPIDDFLREGDLPKTVIPKLLDAKSQGISIIRPVSQLKDAVSIDLVTEAGAGGKILQMIEGAKMAKKKETEVEKKQKQTEAGDPTQGDQAGQAEPQHSDEEQDKALFAKMIKQYLGDDADAHDEETHEMAKHAYQAHREMGMEHEAAYEAAGKHMKMAMEIGKKMHQAHEAHQSEGEAEAHQSEAHQNEGETEAHHEADPDTTVHKTPAGDGKKALPSNVKVPSTPSNKESNPQLIAALGEIARLKESLKKYEMEKYLDKKLSESKHPTSITKKFREALGAPRSKEHIDAAFKLFMTGAETVGLVESNDFSSFYYTEKTTVRESAKGADGSFADCAN